MGGFLMVCLLVGIVGVMGIVVDDCNEAVCGSIVSKCLLTRSCGCERTNKQKECSCCASCYQCLQDLYLECCACVNMCPQSNDTNTDLSRESQVGDFRDSVPDLFKVLTEYPDDRWESFVYPVDIDISQYSTKKEVKIYVLDKEQDTIPKGPNVITFNCTVAFWNDCTSWNKCKTSCNSMGAASFRWFYDGCCECVANGCFNYGINQSQCLYCPRKEHEDIPEDELDYAEDEDF